MPLSPFAAAPVPPPAVIAWISGGWLAALTIVGVASTLMRQRWREVVTGGLHRKAPHPEKRMPELVAEWQESTGRSPST